MEKEAVPQFRFCDSQNPVRYPPRDFDYSGMNFSLRDFRKMAMENICFSHCNFVGAQMDEANLEEADLNNCDLTRASIRNSNLRGCNLEMSKTADADFEGATFDSETHLPFSHMEALEKGMIYRVSQKQKPTGARTFESFRTRFAQKFFRLSPI